MSPGNIPETLENLTKLEQVNLSSNLLSGKYPARVYPDLCALSY
jgi:Leucine-rich repeat (LRR) protein